VQVSKLIKILSETAGIQCCNSTQLATSTGAQ